MPIGIAHLDVAEIKNTCRTPDLPIDFSVSVFGAIDPEQVISKDLLSRPSQKQETLLEKTRFSCRLFPHPHIAAKVGGKLVLLAVLF